MPRMKVTSSPTVKNAKNAKAQPTQEEIALRAYHIFLERGSTPGDELEDWLRAERELTEQLSQPGRKSKSVAVAA